jgi:hypothetical protein
VETVSTFTAVVFAAALVAIGMVPLNESTIGLILGHFPRTQASKHQKSPENRSFFELI